VWHPSNSVGDAFGMCVADRDAVAAIMMKSWANVVSVESMGGKGITKVWSLVDQHATTGWSNRCFVEFEEAVNLGISGKAGVYAGGAEQIQGEEGLRNKFVPLIERQIGRGGDKSRDEVIFECLYSAFSRVLTMDARGGKLGSDAFQFKILVDEVA
jgi:hypothetical protein